MTTEELKTEKLDEGEDRKLTTVARMVRESGEFVVLVTVATAAAQLLER